MNKLWSLIVCLGFLAIPCAFAASAQPAHAEISPSVPTVGDRALYTVTLPLNADGEPRAKLPSVPGVRWIGNQPVSSARNISVINGVQNSSLTLSYAFTVTEAGRTEIPEIIFKMNGGKEFRTNKLTFNAVRVPKTPDSKEAAQLLAFMRLTIPEGTDGVRKTFYAGEEIPLRLEIYTREGVRLSQEQDIRIALDPENCLQLLQKSENLSPSERTIEGKRFNVQGILQWVRLLRPGKATVRTAMAVRIYEPGQSDDLFFDRRPAQRTTLRAELGPLEIKPLPPIPEGTYFSGLVGNWVLSCSLSPGPYRAGEPVTVKILASGSGDSGALKLENFRLDGFRAFPPEIVRGANAASVSLTLIPLASGEFDIAVPFCVFDTERGEYRMMDFHKKIQVENAPAGAAAPGPRPEPEKAGSGEPAAARDILYLHDDPGDSLARPLWRNALFPALGLIFAGLIFYTAALIITVRKRTLGSDPELRRRLFARSGKKALLKKLDSIPGEKLPDEAVKPVSEYLNALLSLPPGASLDETAKAVAPRSPELADSLNTLARAAWTPSFARTGCDAPFKKKLLRQLARFSIVLACLLAALPLTGAEAQNEKEARDAYDTGDFQSALAYYRKQGQSGRLSAAQLYNLGNALYQTGDLPRALIAYERAERLSPRDSDIRENLNFVRRKLDLEEKHTLRSPGEFFVYLRDLMRMDEWIVAGAAGLMLCLFGTGLDLIWGRRVLIALCSAGAALIILAVTCAIWQTRTTYDPDEALTVERETPVYTLPSDHSGKIESNLKAGRPVRIVERRLDWLRIRFGQEEGWVRRNAVQPFWEE